MIGFRRGQPNQKKEFKQTSDSRICCDFFVVFRRFSQFFDLRNFAKTRFKRFRIEKKNRKKKRKKKFGAKKSKVANFPKRVLPKFRADRSHVRRVRGRLCHGAVPATKLIVTKQMGRCHMEFCSKPEATNVLSTLRRGSEDSLAIGSIRVSRSCFTPCSIHTN